LSLYAVEEAGRKGIGRVTHADVARAAEVAVPTVFQYFSNREALVQAIIAEVHPFYVRQYTTALDASVAPRDALRNLFVAYADSVDAHPEYAMVWLEWSTSVRNEFGIWDLFLRYQEEMVPKFAATIRRGQRDGSIAAGVAATDAARLVVASAYTISQLKFMGRSSKSIKHFIVSVVESALGEPPV
jgi:TetR/AcrR family hemagglutinin/protease transcriptional regulator